jgi:hypothetical protein
MTTIGNANLGSGITLSLTLSLTHPLTHHDRPIFDERQENLEERKTGIFYKIRIKKGSDYITYHFNYRDL